MSHDDKEGGFISHLAELRKRLINSFLFLIIFFIGCFFFAEYLYGFLVEPFAKAVKDDGSNRRLIFTALQETFLTYLKVSFFAAFFVTCPFILMQIWKFIAPGLYKHEKIAILPYLVLTPVLFLLGGMLVYYLIMPLAKSPIRLEILPLPNNKTTKITTTAICVKLGIIIISLYPFYTKNKSEFLLIFITIKSAIQHFINI